MCNGSTWRAPALHSEHLEPYRVKRRLSRVQHWQRAIGNTGHRGRGDEQGSKKRQRREIGAVHGSTPNGGSRCVDQPFSSVALALRQLSLVQGVIRGCTLVRRSCGAVSLSRTGKPGAKILRSEGGPPPASPGSERDLVRRPVAIVWLLAGAKEL
jgi:hypothetical protein